MRFKIRDIQPNPFRHMENYPIRRDKVEALRKSLRTTGFWDNVVGRVNGDGKPQIAYGHHRWTALQEEYSPDHEVELIIRDLDDAHMLQIMAAENMEEWGTSALVEIETVNAVVEAYGSGKIQLEKPDRIDGTTRYAPSFQQGNSGPGPARYYTAGTVGRFLGWTKGTSDEPQNKVKNALSALELIEQGILSRDDFANLNTDQMTAVVREARQAKADQDRRAREAEAAAERAAMEAAAAELRQRELQARQRQAREQAEGDRLRREAEHQRQLAAAAERRRQAEAEQAARARQRAREQAQAVGRHVSSGMRSGDTAVKGAADRAREVYTPEPKPQPVAKDISAWATTVGTAVVKMLDPETDIGRRLHVVIQHRDSLSEYQRNGLARELRDLGVRALEAASSLSEAISITETSGTPTIIAGHIEKG
jgi:nitrogen regulatory protein PII